MALNKKGSGFGLDLGEKFANVNTNVQPSPNAYTDTDTDTHTDADVENKTRRTYGLVKQSVFDKVSDYAKRNNTSYNAIVCELLEEFIKRNNL